MHSRWTQAEADRFVERYAGRWSGVLAVRTYSARLLGAEPSLVLHGGGNTSVKDLHETIVGERRPALYVKASGADLATIEPGAYLALDLTELRKLRVLESLDDATMARELRALMFAAKDHQIAQGFSPALQDHRIPQGFSPAPQPTPSIETLVHAFLPARFVDHTHADAVLALTNQPDGDRLVRELLGDDVIVLPYVAPGFLLARAVADAVERQPGARGMVWSRHGIVTWGEDARESYEAMIELVTKAERHLASRSARFLRAPAPTRVAVAAERAALVAPVVRGLLAPKTGDPDRPHRRMIVRPLVTAETLEFVDAAGACGLSSTPPLTSDHLIRTKAWPAFVEAPDYGDSARLRAQLEAAFRDYATRYEAYVGRHAGLMPAGMVPFDPLPRVVLMPGLGAFCAGPDLVSATLARDITAQTLAVKAKVAAFGAYEGLGEADLFKMEYRPLQHAKLEGRGLGVLSGEVALVTGAAGAIGSGVCRELLERGCLVAATDLPGRPLDGLVAELATTFGPRIVGVPLDVTDPSSVATAFRAVASTWGGVDIVIVNAGIAHVAPLDQMDLETFRRLERVNIEGTLLVLAESARHFRTQATGGDIVLVSTKNVFAPGAKFGAYSATKAAAHQLARIASLEMADLDVRVNMVSPDAVFSDGGRKSGLWAEVGPDRMRARGLDEAGLEAYYRSRNLLKAGVTAKHVASAVIFFVTRQTPTTGSTIPVDGGLPDATPR
jgi:rhamnose utilization protein RhaD (predicted bifunctional aldolase and dehydrogenase)/NAD(P)-dependent dehydrogenase (short-subunit alcohol dehydrogenase family)